MQILDLFTTVVTVSTFIIHFGCFGTLVHDAFEHCMDFAIVVIAALVALDSIFRF